MRKIYVLLTIFFIKAAVGNGQVCNPVNIPYLEKFDGVISPAIPACITIQNIGNNSSTWRTIGLTDPVQDIPVSASNFMRLDFEPDGVTPGDDWFFTEGLNLTGGVSYRLRFNYRNSDALTYIEQLEVKYGSAANAASMTSGTLFINTNIDFNSWTDAPVIDFTPAVTGVYYLGFHGMSAADQAFLCIDNVNVILTPLCEPPTNVFVTSITGSSAVISFTSPGTNFIAEYGPIGFTPGIGAGAGGGTIVTGSLSPILLSGLTASTGYDVYVRRDCGGGSISPNTLPVSFITGPPNDDAPGAILLTLGAGCSGALYTNINATASVGEVFPSCSGSLVSPVWFKFVAPASGAVRISTDIGSGNTLSDTKVGLFSIPTPADVTDYTKFSIISCDEDGGSVLGSGLMSVVYATGLTAGTTYYIAVDKFSTGTFDGTFCIAVDELNTSMIASANTCGSSYQVPSGSNATYSQWQPLVDGSSNLIALIKNPVGGAVQDYNVSQNINAGAARMDATSSQRYLNRNFRITNTSATNVDVQFFFLNSELTALQAVDPAVTLANLGVTRQTETVAGCHTDFSAGNGASTYLKQTGNGSVNGVSWISATTPGFSNFYLHTSKTPVTLKVFLQGAYSTADLRHKNVTTQWAAILNANALNQPYNVAPFNYIGTESVSPGFFTASTIVTTDVLDWVLLELRDATTPATVISRRAAFVREDGTIVDIDGLSPVSFRGVANGNYHLAIRHRNHLGVRTSAVQALDGTLGSNPGPALYDFTISQSQAFDNPVVTTNDAMAQNGSVFLMWAGNANGDDFARVTPQGFPSIPSDAAYILGTILSGLPNSTVTGYSVGDINLDGNVRVTPQGFPSILSDAAIILGTPLSGNPNATRREHK